uniref:hypothetical protein n=1 Tax=Enterobacter hormaechei TaxID=158836 RepID=UPI001954ECC3
IPTRPRNGEQANEGKIEIYGISFLFPEFEEPLLTSTSSTRHPIIGRIKLLLRAVARIPSDRDGKSNLQYEDPKKRSSNETGYLS